MRIACVFMSRPSVLPISSLPPASCCAWDKCEYEHVYWYVWICMHIYTCTFIYICIHTYVCILIYVYICTYLYKYLYIYIYIYNYVYIYIYIYIHIYIYMHVYTPKIYTYTYACSYINMCWNHALFHSVKKHKYTRMKKLA